MLDDHLPNAAAMLPTVELRATNIGKTKTGLIVSNALWATHIWLQAEEPLVGDWPFIDMMSSNDQFEFLSKMSRDIGDCILDGTDKFNGTDVLMSDPLGLPTVNLKFSLAPGSNLSCVAGTHHNFDIQYLPPGVVSFVNYPDRGRPGWDSRQPPRFPNMTLVIPRSPHLTVKINVAGCKATSMTGKAFERGFIPRSKVQCTIIVWHVGRGALRQATRPSLVA